MRSKQVLGWSRRARSRFVGDGWRTGRTGVAAIVCAIALIVAATAQAATITVDSTADDTAGGHCTLREAIDSAIGFGAIGNCGTTTDTTNQIVFASGLTGTITLTSLLPYITGGVLTITGPATAPGITIDGDHKYPVMGLDSAATLNLANLTIANGSAGGGGGIANSGGTLTVTNSTFSGNIAADNGGGIANSNGALTVTNSTFSGNSATQVGGGIFNAAGALTVTNSTFSGNSAGARSGGGIFNALGGRYQRAGTVTLKNTILANEPTGGNCFGTITDGGYNLSDDDTCNFSATGSQNNVTDAALNLDPNELQDNGGPTQTIALLQGSVAIDAVPYADCTYPSDSVNPCSTSLTSNPINERSVRFARQLTCDQRGEPRPDPLDGPEGNCDIGAYEYQDTFAGTPGKANCRGQSVSYLAGQYGGIHAAAAALGYSSVKALHHAIRHFCKG